MVFITAWYGWLENRYGLAAPVIGKSVARELGYLTVAVVTKAFSIFERVVRRARGAGEGSESCVKNVDSLIKLFPMSGLLA